MDERVAMLGHSDPLGGCTSSGEQNPFRCNVWVSLFGMLGDPPFYEGVYQYGSPIFCHALKLFCMGVILGKETFGERRGA